MERPVSQPIVSDSVMVVTEVLRQDVQACSWIDSSLWNGDTGAVEVTFDLVGTPDAAFLLMETRILLRGLPLW